MADPNVLLRATEMFDSFSARLGPKRMSRMMFVVMATQTARLVLPKMGAIQGAIIVALMEYAAAAIFSEEGTFQQATQDAEEFDSVLKKANNGTGVW